MKPFNKESIRLHNNFYFDRRNKTLIRGIEVQYEPSDDININYEYFIVYHYPHKLSDIQILIYIGN